MKIFNISIIGLFLVSLSACKKFLEVNAPLTSINTENVYTSDGTAISAVTGMYTQMSVRGMNDFSGIGLYAGLSADELRPYSGDANAVRSAVYKNTQDATTNGTYSFWANLYPYVYYANAAIEGLNSATSLTPAIKKQLTGEAYFVRAFTYFYLTNIYGDVPLVLSSDYKTSSSMPRTSRADVYSQVVNDLKLAKSLLSSSYVDGTLLSSTTDRIRPTSVAAAALLARVYLYKGEYANAEAEATTVISNTNYGFVPLANTFLKNSKETIWALQPVGASASTAANSPEGSYYIPTGLQTFGALYPVYLNDSFINSFEPGDNRLTSWVASKGSAPNLMYYSFKYKIGLINTNPFTEYSIVLRLAEQYLIRAEARAQQNNTTGALADLNAIRNRSGLGNSLAVTQSEILTAVAKERKVELFTEWGDRWFNMQRTNSVDAIMTQATSAKGGTWNSNQKLYPIPSTELQKNPALTQNAGYN